MAHRASSLAKLVLVVVVLVGAAAAPAWARHFVRGSYHHYVAAPPHQPAGGQPHGNTGTATGGTPDPHENNSGTPSGSDTKQSEKGEARTSRGEDHNATAGDGNGGPHSDDHAGNKPAGLSGSPIDTSNTIVGPPKWKNVLRARYGQKPKTARLLGNSSYHLHASFHVTHDKVVRNSIGLPVHRATVDSKATDGAPKSVDPAGGGGGAVGPELHRQGFVPLPANGKRPDPPISTAMNRSVINGRDMIRPGMTTGAIGGAAKFGTGVIKGSDFHSKP